MDPQPTTETAAVDSPAAAGADRICRWLLLAGIVVRLLTFALMEPYNNDLHLQVVQFLVGEGRLARSGELEQSSHPPLYTLLAAPVWMATHSPKAVQALSLLFSIGTLWLLGRLLARPALVGAAARPWCLALAAFHPQFVLHSLFISNDGLSFLLGAALLLAVVRAVERRGTRRAQLEVALVAGLGLLTKQTFLALAPAAIVAAALARPASSLDSSFELRTSKSFRIPHFAFRIRTVAWMLAVVVVVGGYKFAEDWVTYGQPLLSNLDFGWAWIDTQRPTVLGWRSLVDVDVLKLVADPTFGEATRHSLPLLLYGSFWYAMVPEPTFLGNTTSGNVVGSMIDLAALWPTLLIGWGMLLTLMPAASPASARSAFRIPRSALPPGARLIRCAAVLMLLLNLALVLAAGLRYDVWSIFQGRLLFAAYGGVLVGLGAGLDALWHGGKPRRAALMNLVVLFVLFGFYYLFEWGLIVSDWIVGAGAMGN